MHGYIRRDGVEHRHVLVVRHDSVRVHRRRHRRLARVHSLLLRGCSSMVLVLGGGDTRRISKVLVLRSFRGAERELLMRLRCLIIRLLIIFIIGAGCGI